MKKLLTAALCAAALLPAPALAGSADGKLQVKLLGTGVLPDGKITKVDFDPLGLTAGAQTKASDNVVPTIAIEYFFTPNISAETICCLTMHHINGTGTLAGAGIVKHVQVLPATLTLKYHLPLAGGIKPYVGVGPSVFFYIDEKPGTAVAALGVDRAHLDDKVGVALQAGVDIPLGENGLGVSIDAKKYFMKTQLHLYAAGAEVLTTTHKVDPWVLSAGIAYRF